MNHFDVRLFPVWTVTCCIAFFIPVASHAQELYLQIVSERGDTQPPTGIYTFHYGTPVTPQVLDPLIEYAGTRWLCAGWSMPGHEPTTGDTYSFTMTITNSTTLTWLWDSYMYLSHIAHTGGTITGEPPGYQPTGEVIQLFAEAETGYFFHQWSGDVDTERMYENPLELTMNHPLQVEAHFIPSSPDAFAYIGCDGYHSPGHALFTARFYYPEGEHLMHLSWQPGAPADWMLLDVLSGDGSPYVDGTEIRFSETLTANPVEVVYQMLVPPMLPSMLITEIHAAASFQLASMTYPSLVIPQPDPFYVHRFHSADYRPPFWVIDNTEINRILAYWRAGGYRPNAIGYDGFAPTNYPDPSEAPKRSHSADFRTPSRVLDAVETSAALALWRAGGYQVDVHADSGYNAVEPIEDDKDAAIGTFHTFSTERDTLEEASTSVPATITMEVPAAYVPGERLEIQVTIELTDSWLGMCWIPSLPDGWVIESVSGTGNPEVQRNEVLWTGELPVGQVSFTCVIMVPADATGSYELDGTLVLHASRYAVPYEFSETASIASDESVEGIPPPDPTPPARIRAIQFHAAGEVLLDWENDDGHYRVYHSDCLRTSIRSRAHVITERTLDRVGEKEAVLEAPNQTQGFFWLIREEP